MQLLLDSWFNGDVGTNMVLAQYRVNVILHTIYQKTEGQISDDKVLKDLCCAPTFVKINVSRKLFAYQWTSMFSSEKSIHRDLDQLLFQEIMYIFKCMDSIPVCFIAW